MDDLQPGQRSNFVRRSMYIFQSPKLPLSLISMCLAATKPARGVVAPPYEKTAHWTMDFATFENIEGGPAV